MATLFPPPALLVSQGVWEGGVEVSKSENVIDKEVSVSVCVYKDKKECNLKIVMIFLEKWCLWLETWKPVLTCSI